MFKYVRPFSGHQALKGLNTISSQTIFFSNLLKINGYLQIGDSKVTKKQTNDGLIINLLDKNNSFNTLQNTKRVSKRFKRVIQAVPPREPTNL